GAAFEVANLSGVGIDLPGCARAIKPLVNGRRYRNFSGRLQFRNPMQAVANNFNLRRELRFVSQLLKITTAATAEVRTWRFHSHGGSFENLDNRGEADGALHSIDSYAHNVARRGEGNKQRQ